MESGGIIALILEPSASLESTIGLAASIVFPRGPTILVITLKICSLLIKETALSFTILPSIST